MLYLTRKPAPPLDRFIDCLWYCERYEPGHERERGLPGGSMEVVIALAHDHIPHCPTNRCAVPERWSHSLVAGAHSEYMLIDTVSLRSMAGIAFRPGGAGPFLGPAGLFAEKHVALEDIWGRREAGRLRERLLEAPAAEGKLAAMEEELRRFVRPGLARDRAIEDAVARFDLAAAPAVAEAARRANLSPRRFAERFRREVGLTPALYRRIRRFRRALERLHAGREVSFTEVALDCGYYDHAHFDHDFRAFSGVSPLVYFRNRGGSAWSAHLAVGD